MIDLYLNQMAIWHRATGKNEYGEPVTEDSNIKVRWEGKRRLVRNAQGQEVVSEAKVFCLEPIKPGDILEHGGRQWPVIAVTDVTDLDGNVLHREVAV